jgi:dipeptidyl aminopeptidase/acylaminoacyl peptidase
VRHPSSVAAVDYGVSENDTLIYVPAAPAAPPPRTLVWVDRDGRVSGRAIEEPVEGARDPRLSPDGSRLLLAAGPIQELHLWLHDLRGSPPIPLVTDGVNARGVWSPDGSRVAFTRTGPGSVFYGIFTIDVDARSRSPVPVPTPFPVALTSDWSSQGDLLLNRVPSPDIVAYRSSDQSVRDVVATSDSEVFPALSPNERWLAYASNRTGRYEIWVMRYPDGASAPISSAGGTEPRWARDGSELFFRQGSAMMAVKVASTGDRPFGAVTKLFDQPFVAAENETMWSYDVAADGRFLMMEPTAPTPAAPGTIVVVQNWREELKRLMAAH